MRIVALLHVAEDAVRIVFDYEFHPDVLSKEVDKVKRITKKKMNRSLWETLFNTRDDEGKSLYIFTLCFINILFIKIEF